MDVKVRTDSVTVLSWVNFIVEERGRICMKGTGEMIVQWILGILKMVISGLQVKAVFVPSEKKQGRCTHMSKQKMVGCQERKKRSLYAV